MTSGVDYHTANTPGAQLMKLAQEIYDADVRHRDLGWAMMRAREQRPDLVALDHAGLPEDPGPLVDPGMILGAARDSFMAKGWNRAEAWSAACDAHPEAFTAWNGGQMMPADQATKHEASTTVYRNADPATEIMRLTEEMLTADSSLTVDQARKLVMDRDPVLTNAYCEQRPLPLGAQPTKRDNLIEAAMLEVQKMGVELAKLEKLAAPAPVKKLRRYPLHRPIRNESELKPGEILLHKLSGGFYAVPEFGA